MCFDVKEFEENLREKFERFESRSEKMRANLKNS
jgi:hypothetical protein